MCKIKYDLSETGLKVIAVSNRKLCERPFLKQIERVCQMKPQAIILREKRSVRRGISDSVRRSFVCLQEV